MMPHGRVHLILSALLSLSSLFAGHAVYGAKLSSTKPSYQIKTTKELKGLVRERDQAMNTNERNWLTWQIALNAPMVGETKQALKEISYLKLLKAPPVERDLMHLTEGRIHFQRRQFPLALKSYESVGEKSEYWFEALEEMTWTLIRMGRSDEARAKLATLLNPLFQKWVNAEAYYAQGYLNLKTCDYVSLFKFNNAFKERFKARVEALSTLAGKLTSESAKAVASKMIQGARSWSELAEYADQLPRFFWRDDFVRRHATAKNASELVLRLSAMAQTEVTEMKVVIHKLNIIETEAIERLYLDQSLLAERPELEEESSNPNQIRFPYTDELWLDEINQYQAKVKHCPILKEATL